MTVTNKSNSSQIINSTIRYEIGVDKLFELLNITHKNIIITFIPYNDWKLNISQLEHEIERERKREDTWDILISNDKEMKAHLAMKVNEFVENCVPTIANDMRFGVCVSLAEFFGLI